MDVTAAMKSVCNALLHTCNDTTIQEMIGNNSFDDMAQFPTGSRTFREYFEIEKSQNKGDPTSTLRYAHQLQLESIAVQTK